MAWKKDYQALKEQKTEELFEMVKEKLYRTAGRMRMKHFCLHR